jgi:hypothetical protein
VLPDDVNKFIDELKSVAFDLSEQKRVTGAQYYELKNYPSYREEAKERAQLAGKLFDLERKMFSKMENEIRFLRLEASEDRTKFHLWCVILREADRACQSAKENFSDEGFSLLVDQQVSSEAFRNLVDWHAKLVIELFRYREFLPKNTSNLLDDICAWLKITGIVPPSPSDQPIKEADMKENDVVIERSLRVFISYNHDNRDVALKLKKALVDNGINVTIDIETMKAGEDITNFIVRSIRDTDVTLAVISNKSLLSPWMATETIHTFYHGKFESQKKFIASYLDDDFFQDNFRIDATKPLVPGF